MDFTFLSPSGDVAFFRSDAEQAEWTQEEMRLLCTFPYRPEQNIERGMTVLFRDPAIGDWHGYEIRQCSTFTDQAYQQFTAEDIAISELEDCFLPEEKEFSNVTPQSVLSTLLSGTGWEVGTVGNNGKSSGDTSRGSVWSAIGVVQKNWNVYIIPRVTVGADGITKRFLDIVSPAGEWRGLRISIRKNMNDPCVTYEDSDLKTALYGFGASYTEGEGENRKTKEKDFSGIAWSKTSDHPAKPAGQKYIEDPDKTRLYGRGGKPRFGYYQSTEIEDPAILLQKTWEVLKTVSEPKISISGTVADLSRMGYADEPLRLHDMAIVEVEDTGEQFYRQIIQLTIDLLNPARNTPNIGSYIPNIIYINRDTEETASGGRGSGGGASNNKKKQGEFETVVAWNERTIDLHARQIDEHGNTLRQAGMEIDPITGVLIYHTDNENMIGAKMNVLSSAITLEVTNRQKEDQALSGRITVEANRITQEVTNRINGDSVLSGRITVEANRITQEVTNREKGDETLAGRITVQADRITAEVTNRKSADEELSGRIDVEAGRISLVVTGSGANAKVDAASIVLGINAQTGSFVQIRAGTIDLDGYVTVSQLNATNASITNLTNGTTTANKLACTALVCGTLTKGSYSYGEAAFYDMNGNIKYCLCRS